MVFLGGVVLIFSSLYLIIFSSCGPNNLALAPIGGEGGGEFNSQLLLFSVGTYKMNTNFVKDTVKNTLNNMRGILLYSSNGGNNFNLLGNPFISP